MKKYEIKEKNPYDIYIKEYNINVVIRYPLKENENENEELENQGAQKDYKNNLEALIEKIKEKFEKQINKERNHKSNLEEKLQENEKYILPNNYKNKLPNQDKKIYSYLAYLSSQTTGHHINPKSKAHIFYVNPSALPENVLGMYVQSSHTIYIANNLSYEEERFVYYHEEYHSIYGAGEDHADAYAFQKTGYNLRSAA